MITGHFIYRIRHSLFVWLKLWKMSSLLLFVNIQSLLMARRWNRLWDNSLQFNSAKKSQTKCKKKKHNYEYLHIVWTICALMASDTPLHLEEALKWQPYNINLLMYIEKPSEYINFWPQKSPNSAIKFPSSSFPNFRGGPSPRNTFGKFSQQFNPMECSRNHRWWHSLAPFPFPVNRHMFVFSLALLLSSFLGPYFPVFFGPPQLYCH